MTQPPAQRPDLGAATHPSRVLQQRLLVDPADFAGWRELGELYRRMAAEWTEWADQFPDYAAPVAAGLGAARISRRPPRRTVEVACGTGQATRVLSAAGLAVLATDAVLDMVRLIPPLPGIRPVAADVRALPIVDGAADLVVGLNAVLDSAEVNRVVPIGGRVLWCSSFGPSTPLYLSTAGLLQALGPGWRADDGVAGLGEWILATREAA